MKPSKVQLKKQSQNYQLSVDGNPFYIKGAGLELGSIKSLADYGGNAFRTWRVDNGEKSGLEILDEAQRYGLMVCMGLDVARERHGFDYSDKQAVAQQLAAIEQDILALKDHPALLMWGIGNELNLRHSNPKVWNAVDDISKMIHRLDPNHPTTTMLAGAEPEVIKLVVARCPDLDLLSFQLYGEIDQLPDYLSQSGFSGAYTVSEWGATGHWESACTDWDRPFEANSSVKAGCYQQRYIDYIAADRRQCLGSFVFLWGQKQERTPTWYGVFLEQGQHTESAQVMGTLWTSQAPEQPVARLLSLDIEGLQAPASIYLTEQKNYAARVTVDYQQPETLSYHWELLKEVDKKLESDGGDFEPRPETVWHQRGDSSLDRVEFPAPAPGEYRLFVLVVDSHGGAATANLPVLVETATT
ncbi:MAG: glycoside hydrolase family 2 TIM barrel-domain containing protein [Porticoccaceae bacterium]|nr:glycoside hydrolase family 2 TIM barrel-domain containing protein [Porticoccaceae bacterium]MDG1706980.1 glycoside hydrolase family 2 TIM barrel-domain containing protein [Porticoccaceae bacterium]